MYVTGPLLGDERTMRDDSSALESTRYRLRRDREFLSIFGRQYFLNTDLIDEMLAAQVS
jgi:hypothetical protein